MSDFAVQVLICGYSEIYDYFKGVNIDWVNFTQNWLYVDFHKLHLEDESFELQIIHSMIEFADSASNGTLSLVRYFPTSNPIYFLVSVSAIEKR